jgi:hypothetical protein
VDYTNGNLWSVQLYAAAGTNVPAELLMPVPGAVANLYTFSWNQGLFQVTGNPAVDIPGVPLGSAATLQLKAWYNGNGAYTNYEAALNAGQPTGQSTTGSELLGGGPITPPDLPGPGNPGVTGGITSFSLVNTQGTNLIDVAFTSATTTSKTGFAAIGVTPNDFWNTYDLNSGLLPNLEFADGTTSDAGLMVANANGASTNGASDPMYGIYLYSDGGNITVTVTNLNQGVYDLYLYGHGNEDDEDSVFQLTIGSQSYGSEATTNNSGWLSSVWQEGVQYVRFSGVNVSGGQSITITVEPGAGGYAVLSGLQTMQVGPTPNFVVQPTNQAVVDGATATFSVVVSGAAPLAYQWLFNNAIISGATNSSFSVTNAQSADAGNYSAIVTNSYGSVTSTVAALTVTNISILMQPASQTVLAGESATFTVKAVGPAPLSYQWLFNNADISGATNSSYTVTNALSADASDYSVIVTNAYGTIISQVAALTVSNILILTPPASQTVLAGASATFTIEATGPAPLGYQWLFNSTAISGATNSSYTVSNAYSADAGYYSVIVADVYGSVTSAVAELIVISTNATDIDVAFTYATATSKTGLAATGVTANDFWNTYDPQNGIMPNLKFVDGTTSGAGMAVANVDGVYGNGASDPMYGVYLWTQGNITVTITNLRQGAYDIYLYGHGNGEDQDSLFQLTAGSQSYGTEATTTGTNWISSTWQEGVQYVEFTNLSVSPGQPITIRPCK